MTADAQTNQGTVAVQARQDVNYIRNSVKAVVDAYDGTVTLYAWDEDDPVLKTWRKAFPTVVQPKSAITADLRHHLRYPQDLFKVQRQVLGRYHVTNPDNWYQNTSLWEIPKDPIAGATSNTLEPPFYLSIKWPVTGEPSTFSLTTAFVPKGRSNLAAYFAVNADASSPDYGLLRVLRMSDSSQIDGPGQSFNAMTTNEKVADRLRPFLNQGASSAAFGNLLTLPVGGGLLYVTPSTPSGRAAPGRIPRSGSSSSASARRSASAIPCSRRWTRSSVSRASTLARAATDPSPRLPPPVRRTTRPPRRLSTRRRRPSPRPIRR